MPPSSWEAVAPPPCAPDADADCWMGEDRHSADCSDGTMWGNTKTRKSATAADGQFSAVDTTGTAAWLAPPAAPASCTSSEFWGDLHCRLQGVRYFGLKVEDAFDFDVFWRRFLNSTEGGQQTYDLRSDLRSDLRLVDWQFPAVHHVTCLHRSDLSALSPRDQDDHSRRRELDLDLVSEAHALVAQNAQRIAMRVTACVQSPGLFALVVDGNSLPEAVRRLKGGVQKRAGTEGNKSARTEIHDHSHCFHITLGWAAPFEARDCGAMVGNAGRAIEEFNNRRNGSTNSENAAMSGASASSSNGYYCATAVGGASSSTSGGAVLAGAPRVGSHSGPSRVARAAMGAHSQPAMGPTHSPDNWGVFAAAGGTFGHVAEPHLRRLGDDASLPLKSDHQASNGSTACVASTRVLDAQSVRKFDGTESFVSVYHLHDDRFGGITYHAFANPLQIDGRFEAFYA